MELYREKRYLTKSEVKDRGWTEMAIEKLLGEPDRMRLNHLYKNTKPIKLYYEDRVLEMEATDHYREFLQRKMKANEGRTRNKKRKNK